MKKILIAILFGLTTFVVYANDEFVISDLAKNKDTKTIFEKMVGKEKLPSWVREGGVSPPSPISIKIKGVKYLVFISCMPKNCGNQSIAVLYSPELKEMFGLISNTIEMHKEEKLLWLNGDLSPSFDYKTILFSALSGNLLNDPNMFNL